MKNIMVLYVLIASMGAFCSHQNNENLVTKNNDESSSISQPTNMFDSFIQTIKEKFNAEVPEEDRTCFIALFASSITFIIAMTAYLYYFQPKVHTSTSNILPQQIPAQAINTIVSENPRSQTPFDYLPSPDPLRPNLSYPKFICSTLADDLETINGATRVKQA